MGRVQRGRMVAGCWFVDIGDVVAVGRTLVDHENVVVVNMVE